MGNQYTLCTETEHSKPTTLPEIGISRKESSISKKISSIPRDEFEARIKENIQSKKRITLHGFLRDAAKTNKAETPVMPSGKYRVIYADPPWS